MSNYSEHEKLKKVSEKSQAIGDFVNWLSLKKEIMFAKYHKTEKGTYENFPKPVCVNIEKYLAEFFEINLDKLEEEKRKILEEMN